MQVPNNEQGTKNDQGTKKVWPIKLPRKWMKRTYYEASCEVRHQLV
jgi:hypothetical protein